MRIAMMAELRTGDRMYVSEEGDVREIVHLHSNGSNGETVVTFTDGSFAVFDTATDGAFLAPDGVE